MNRVQEKEDAASVCTITGKMDSSLPAIFQKKQKEHMTVQQKTSFVTILQGSKKIKKWAGKVFFFSSAHFYFYKVVMSRKTSSPITKAATIPRIILSAKEFANLPMTFLDDVK